MSNKLVEIDLKNCTNCFFHDMINIKSLGPNKIKIDKKSYKNILIYCTDYVTIKDSKYVKIDSEKRLYLIITKVNGYTQKNNGGKYLMLVSTD